MNEVLSFSLGVKNSVALLTVAFLPFCLQNHVPAGLHPKGWPSVPGRQGAQHRQLLTAGLCSGVPDRCDEKGLWNGRQGAANYP